MFAAAEMAYYLDSSVKESSIASITSLEPTLSGRTIHVCDAIDQDKIGRNLIITGEHSTLS